MYRSAALQDHVISKFDLLFVFVETAGGLQFCIEYNSDIYEQSAIERLAVHFQQWLSAVIACSHTPVSRLNYLSTKEQQQLAALNNNTEIGYPANKTIITLFEEQVALTPAAIALVSEEKQLTYQQLNERSNRLAHYLRSAYAIKRDELVVVKAQRTEWMIISLLAVLKAGGAYVPVDPEYPADRINYIINDSGSRLLLDEQELATFLTEDSTYSSANPGKVNEAGDLA